MTPIKILIADDQQLFAEGIKIIIAGVEGLEVVGTAVDGYSALNQIKVLQPDIVLMDINMPGLDGLESCAQIKKSYPNVQVLILSSYSNVEFVANAMHSGADGYLLKNSNIDNLVTAVRQVAQGRKFVSPELRAQRIPEQANISRRELEILKLIGAGFSAQEIAEKLFLSIHTVKTHRKNIQAKLGLRNQAMLVKYVVERGLS